MLIMADETRVADYFKGTEEAGWYARYILDCHYLQQLAVLAMSKKTKRDEHLLQMEEGAKTPISYVQKARELRAKNEGK